MVLKPTDEPTATKLLTYLTGWDEDLCYSVVQVHGTSPASLLSLARTVHLCFENPSEKQILQFVGNSTKGHVFELTEAIVQKDISTALRLSARDDVPAGQLIGALDRKLTTVLSFMAELKKGRTPREAITSMRMPGFLAHGLFEASKKWSARDLLAVWLVLADRATEAEKPGGIDLLITELLS